MINFDDFEHLLSSVFIDFDGYYGDQCVDLVQLWSKALGGPRFWGNAIDIYNQAGTFYTQIANTPTNIPSKGDIVVFGKPYGQYTSSNGNTVYLGHTVIATGNGDELKFEGFEQNDPTGGRCEVKEYSYDGCKGWLHPKQ